MKRRNEVVMPPTPDLTRSGKKRARMGGVDKTPEGPTPRKRKPVTRTRTTLRKYFTASKDKENKPNEASCEFNRVSSCHINPIKSCIFGNCPINIKETNYILIITFVS